MAVTQSITKKFTPNHKDVNYLAKDFSEFRQNLIEFAKSYYPNTYSDFNEASPGMMFIEMASYVGDVLSFYIDNQFKENLLVYARERKNIVAMAQALGYKPRLSSPAMVEATIYQTVPALGISNNYDPDERFYLKILKDSKFSSNTQPSQTFRSSEDVNFADSTNRIIRVFARDNMTGVPTTYVVSKPIKLIAGDVKTIDISFGSAQKFSRIELSDSNIISILSIKDSDGNDWTEVDYLGQDLIIEEREVSVRGIDGYLQSGSIDTTSPNPTKMIVFRRKPKRFVTRVNPNMKMEIWFGSGEVNSLDDVLYINSSQIANDKYDQIISNSTIDPADFLASDTSM
jgi:hypothetical protein